MYFEIGIQVYDYRYTSSWTGILDLIVKLPSLWGPFLDSRHQEIREIPI